MDSAKEIYEYNGEGNKYVLMIGDDDSVKLTDYTKVADGIEMHDVVIAEISGGNGCKRVEYGITPKSPYKSSLPFKNWKDGKLDKRWTQIK
jgi:hypothetical protein